MNPGGGLITLINAQLRAEPTFAQQIRAMHAASVPLLDMVDQLGLTNTMSDQVRSVVEQLSSSDVEAIRQATLEMLDRDEDQMPVDCNLSQPDIDSGQPVSVSVIPNDAGQPTITVRSTQSR